jgi:filamin
MGPPAQPPKSLGKYNKTSSITAQKLENVNKALKAVTDDGVRLENIGGEDIVGGNEKLILGLIWTLIVKYQIALDGADKGKSAKAALIEWLASRGVQVTNFNKDWNSGVALAALVESFAPGLIPDARVCDVGVATEASD